MQTEGSNTRDQRSSALSGEPVSEKLKPQPALRSDRVDQKIAQVQDEELSEDIKDSRHEGLEADPNQRSRPANRADADDYFATPDIRLTAEKGDQEDDFDAAELESELAALHKIVSERTLYEGELRS